MVKAKFRTYFSHSYRPQDRQINKAIWQRFAKKGFFFTVDPPTELASHTHLETMMLRSSCFVAAVSHRPESRPEFCSPFVLAEFELAVQSKIPKLLLIDKKVPIGRFNDVEDDERFHFSFSHLEDFADKLDSRIDELAQRTLPVGSFTEPPCNNVALLVPESGKPKAYAGVRGRHEIRHCVDHLGMNFDELRVPSKVSASFALELGKYECAILDVRGDTLPPWVFAYVYGRFMPTIKLVRLQKDETACSISLPAVVEGLRMRPDEPGIGAAVYWRDSDDLIDQLRRTLVRVTQRGSELREPDMGFAYFDSIGRKPSKVFVSNAGSANDFADELCTLLRRQNIEPWHYKQSKAIPAGAKWNDRIMQELEQCNVFVALLNRDYPESEWCKREMRRARQRAAANEMILLPFQVDKELDGSSIAELIGKTTQASPVYRRPKKACQEVFEEIDSSLRDSRDNKDWRQEQPLLLGASREAIIDSLRHLSVSNYATLKERLRDADIVVDVKPAKRVVQPRHVAELFLQKVQQCTQASANLNDFASTTSVLVAELAKLSYKNRQKTLGDLLNRIEVTMSQRAFDADN